MPSIPHPQLVASGPNRIGREWGIPRLSPRWSRRRRKPASILASLENGGVFTSPRSHTSGLSRVGTGAAYVHSGIPASLGTRAA
jgi:hypothetical protein